MCIRDREKIQELSSALEALENTRADELYEIARQKRQLYGRKSEKKSSLSAMKDVYKRQCVARPEHRIGAACGRPSGLSRKTGEL